MASAERQSLTRRLTVNAVVVLTTVVVCLILLEVGLRVSGRYRMGSLEGFFAPGNGIAYVLKRNFSKRVAWATTSFTVNTSNLGFRSRTAGPHPVGRRPYYVVLGSSDAFGNGLDYDKTFIGILDKRLMDDNLEVVNLAVGALTLRMQTEIFKQFMASVAAPPRAVLVVFNPQLIGGFDGLAAGVVVKRGDLFEGDSWKSALVIRTLANVSATFSFFRDATRNIQLKYLSRQDFSLEFYATAFSAHHSIRSPARLAAFTEALGRFENHVGSLGAEPIFVYSPPPAAFLMDDLVAQRKLPQGLIDTKFFADLIETHSQAAGIRFVNVAPPLQARYDAGQKLNIDLDGHFNEATSALVGRYLYDALRPEKAHE
jgi:hypothetical protein